MVSSQALLRKSPSNPMESSRIWRWKVWLWGIFRFSSLIPTPQVYAHKEWKELLRDFYYKRWAKYWQVLQDQLDGKLPVLPVGNSSTPTADNPVSYTHLLFTFVGKQLLI